MIPEDRRKAVALCRSQPTTSKLLP